MKNLEITIPYTSLSIEELTEDDAALVECARAMCGSSYAPYSHFRVGAAVRLEDGSVVSGCNQENAAYPSGICAERCTMFYANASHPNVAPVSIAIAARDESGEFTKQPITPCGACRQVLIETQNRYGKPLRVILFGLEQTIVIPSVSLLLPFQFDANAL